MFRAGSSATDNEGANRGYLSGYLDPRLQRLPCEPSWPGFPRSPMSTPRSTAGATDPWKTLSAEFVASDDSQSDKNQNCSMTSRTANKVNELNEKKNLIYTTLLCHSLKMIEITGVQNNMKLS